MRSAARPPARWRSRPGARRSRRAERAGSDRTARRTPRRPDRRPRPPSRRRGADRGSASPALTPPRAPARSGAAGTGQRHADEIERSSGRVSTMRRRVPSAWGWSFSSTRLAGSSSTAHQKLNRSGAETSSTQPVRTRPSDSNSASPPGLRSRRTRSASQPSPVTASHTASGVAGSHSSRSIRSDIGCLLMLETQQPATIWLRVCYGCLQPTGCTLANRIVGGA